jgi:hypothetical protein
MTTRVAANDMFMRHASDSLKCGEQGTTSQGHVGPVLLSDTGRTVWTGRVAIGRYQAPAQRGPPQSALDPGRNAALRVEPCSCKLGRCSGLALAGFGRGRSIRLAAFLPAPDGRTTLFQCSVCRPC